MTPRTGLKDNIENLRAVVACIEDGGHTLATDWLEQAHASVLEGAMPDEPKWQAIIEENFAAIAKADIVIADVTFDSTALGYQIATAIHQKKPTLLLLREGSVAPSFTWNIPSSFLKRVEYNNTNVKEKVEPFLEENNITTKDMRFNFFIDRAIYNYLRWSALKTGKTKAEVLRELVQREIEKKDY